MESKGVPLNLLLQQFKEIEARDTANAKKIKECEAIIKNEEENIKQLQVLQNKLNLELKRKLQKNSQNETTHEILLKTKITWLELLDKIRNELKNEEAKLDDMQQSICINRISFCDNMSEFLDKHNLLHISGGFAEKATLPTTTNIIKTEVDADEYKYLFDTIQCLQNELEELKAEEAQIEETKRLKLQLQAEPSSGENFLRLQKALKDIKDEIKNLDAEIKSIKSGIAQTELKILNQSNPRKSDVKSQQSDILLKSQTEISAQCTTRFIYNKRSATPKLVTFKDSVEVQSNASSPPKNDIMKTFTSNSIQTITPSPMLRKQLKQNKTASNLDKEMKEILFKNKD